MHQNGKGAARIPAPPQGCGVLLWCGDFGQSKDGLACGSPSACVSLGTAQGISQGLSFTGFIDGTSSDCFVVQSHHPKATHNTLHERPTYRLDPHLLPHHWLPCGFGTRASRRVVLPCKARREGPTNCRSPHTPSNPQTLCVWSAATHTVPHLRPPQPCSRATSARSRQGTLAPSPERVPQRAHWSYGVPRPDLWVLPRSRHA